MTSWPWMKGIETSIADPIDPICPEDDRPSVNALIEEHSEKIAKIRAALEEDPLYEPSKHDDLWILRFWLSHRKSKNAIEAARYTLAFRQEHNLDEKDIRHVPPHQVQDGLVGEYLACWKNDAFVLTCPNPKRGIICFMKPSSMDPNATAKNCTYEHWVAVFTFLTEWTHQWLDYVTRTTGRLTKTARVVDCSGISLNNYNREASKMDGQAMGLMEDCYPQLLETVLVCNAPTLVGVLWKVVSTLLPKRVVSKFDIINPQANEKDHQKLIKHISNEDLPDFVGGKNPVDPQYWAMENTEGERKEIVM